MREGKEAGEGCLSNQFYRASVQPDVAKQIIVEVCRCGRFRFRVNKLCLAFNHTTRNRVMLWLLSLGLFTIYSHNSRGIIYQRMFKDVDYAVGVVDDAS